MWRPSSSPRRPHALGDPLDGRRREGSPRGRLEGGELAAQLLQLRLRRLERLAERARDLAVPDEGSEVCAPALGKIDLAARRLERVREIGVQPLHLDRHAVEHVAERLGVRDARANGGEDTALGERVPDEETVFAGGLHRGEAAVVAAALAAHVKSQMGRRETETPSPGTDSAGEAAAGQSAECRGRGTTATGMLLMTGWPL